MLELVDDLKRKYILILAKKKYYFWVEHKGAV